jgi:hypothetical protein
MSYFLWVRARFSIWNWTDQNKLENTCTIIYALQTLFAKWALLLLIKRIFTTITRDFVYWLLQLLITLNIMFYVAGVFLETWICVPREKIWHLLVPGHCINYIIPFILTAIWNLVMDVIILLIPLWCIVTLQMPIKRKLGVCAIFATGTV